MPLTQQHANSPRGGLEWPLPEDFFTAMVQLPRPATSLCRRAVHEDTTASHGNCRNLTATTRHDCLARPQTAGGLEQQGTTASHGTARRLVSDDTTASHDHSWRTCSWPLTALVPEVLQRR